MTLITITVASTTLHAELNESATAQQIKSVLPIEGVANRWGEEIYFHIPVSATEAPDARSEVEVGTLAYWPPGNAFCIFFGPTPVSTGDLPRAYSPVNVVGRVLDDAKVLRKVHNGAAVRIDQAETAP